MSVEDILKILGSAVIGGGFTLLGIFLNNVSNSRRSKAEFEYGWKKEVRLNKIAKGEELYELFHSWAIVLINYSLGKLRVINREIDYNQSLDLDISSKTDKVDYGRMEMLIFVYFKNLENHFRFVQSKRDRINDIVALFRKEYLTGNWDQKGLTDKLIIAQNEFDQASEVFKVKLVKEIENV